MECGDCSETFSSRRELVQHRLDEHGDEMNSHERDELKRELNSLQAQQSGDSTDYRPAVMSVVALLAIAGIGYAVVASGFVSFSTSGGTSTPTGNVASVGPVGSAHQHAQFSVTVDGERIDFSQQRYQLQSDLIHFEGGDGTTIHKHATGVTIDYALQTLGMDIRGDCLTVHGNQYCEGEGSDLSVTAGGEEVNASTYVIQDGVPVNIEYSSG